MRTGPSAILAGCERTVHTSLCTRRGRWAPESARWRGPMNVPSESNPAMGAPGKIGEWVRRAHGMLTGFPVEAARKSAATITTCYERGGMVLACGNGGSAAEAEHLVAELVGKFERDRAPLPALTLHANAV